MLKRNTIANFVAQAYVNLLQLAFVPVYIHYIGITGFGLVGLYSVLQAAFNLLDFGMTPTLTREVARYTGGGSDAPRLRNFLRSFEYCGLAAFLFVSLLVYAFGAQISRAWISSPDVSASSVHVAIAVTAQVASLRLIEGIYRGCLNGLQQQVTLNALSAASATLRGVPTIAVLAFVSPTIEAFFFTQLVAAFVSVAAFRYVAMRRLPAELRHGRFDLAALSHFKRFAGAMFVTAVAGSGLVLAEKLTLTKLLSLTDYGYYTLASLAAAAIYSFVYPVIQAWAPRLAQLHAAEDETEFARTFHIGAQMISCIAGSAAIWLIVFAQPILTLWTGKPQIADNTFRLLQILTLANMLNGLVTMPIQAQIAYRHVRFIVTSELSVLILIVPGILVLTPIYGAPGAAACLVVLHLGVFAYNFIAGLPQIIPATRWSFLLFDVLAPLAAALATTVVIRLLGIATHIPDWLQVVVSPPLVAGAALLAAPRLREQGLAYVTGWRAKFA